MIDIPVDVVVRKVVEQKGLSEADVRERIKEKLRQLSGLVSEEGAAHIVANELGCQLYKVEGPLKISELSLAAKSATIVGRVLGKYEVRAFDKGERKGRVANLMLGDETGRVRVVFWNDQVDLFEKLGADDTLRLKHPTVKENNGRLELHLNDRSQVEQNPAGVEVKARQSFEGSRPTRQAKYLRDVVGGEENLEVLGTIVQVYDPRFFDVCPECGKKVADGKCSEHGVVRPVTNYVTSAILDDGTGSMRTTFWKQQTQRLFGLPNEEILRWKENPTLAEPKKHDLLGEIVKVVGRAKKNDQFDRIELTASLIFKDVNPEEEIEKLAEKAGPRTAQAPPQAPPKAPATVIKKEEVAFTNGDEFTRIETEEEIISFEELEKLDEEK